jgi:hypothetical protein
MLQRDYILRMVEQCAQALARVLFKLNAEGREAAEVALADASRSVLGLEPQALLMLPAAEIARIFTSDGRLDVARAGMAVRVLCEAAALDKAAGGEARARSFARHARELFAVVMPRAERGDLPVLAVHAESYAQLALELEGRERLAGETLALCRYYELKDDFARAEDKLYELLEQGGAGGERDSEHHELGLAFYRRLLGRSDDELKRGNLPRDEVEEGLQRLRG